MIGVVVTRPRLLANRSAQAFDAFHRWRTGGLDRENGCGVRVAWLERTVQEIDPGRSGLSAAIDKLRHRLAPVASRLLIRGPKIFMAGDWYFFKAPGDWRVFFDVRRIEDELVAVVVHGVGHTRDYMPLTTQPQEQGRVLGVASAAIADADVVAALIDPARVAEEQQLATTRARIQGLSDRLRRAMRAPGRLAQVHEAPDRVVEHASFVEQVNWADDADRIRETLATLVEGSGTVPANPGFTARFVGDVLHLHGPRDVTDDQPRRVYGRRLIHRQADWLVLHEDTAVAMDPCLPFDREELVVLNSVTSPKHMPALINGPAGSGKSTMLAEFLAHLFTRSDADVRFITFSDRLARETSARLQRHLRVHYGASHEEAVQLVEGRCHAWDPLLRHVLDESESPFRDRRRVSPAQFRDWYQTWSRHRAAPLPAPLVWWMIRSVLKGQVLGDEGTLDDLGRDDRATVGERAGKVGLQADVLLQRVREEVLPSYEDWLKATGRYDDQDLAAAAIRHLGAAQEGIAAALVCDEVQDFTSLQLRAVLSLLHQTHHDLDDVQGLPLVMAGDADQQVHHSGFTWARFRGLLGQEMRALGARPAVPGQLELRTNHRSQANIVDVAQQVQRERRERFRTAASDIVAARDAGTSVGAISMQSRGAPLASILEASHVIVPDEFEIDEAAELLARRPDLEALMGGGGETRLHCAPLAKGMEYPAVVVYGFGRVLASPASHDDDFAALYVAASRATRHLLFLEPDEAGLQAVTRVLALQRLAEADIDALAAAVQTDSDLYQDAMRWLRDALEERDRALAERAGRLLSSLGPSYALEAEACARVASGLGNDEPDGRRLGAGAVADTVLEWAIDRGAWDWASWCNEGFERVAKLLNGDVDPGNVMAAVQEIELRPSLADKLAGHIGSVVAQRASTSWLTSDEWGRVHRVVERLGVESTAAVWACAGLGLPELAAEVAPDPLWTAVVLDKVGIDWLPPNRVLTPDRQAASNESTDVLRGVLAAQPEFLAATARQLHREPMSITGGMETEIVLGAVTYGLGLATVKKQFTRMKN